MGHRTFVGGFVHVRATMCPTCVFWPGNRADLRPGRREEMVAEATANESQIPCHTHLDVGATVEPTCRGFFDRHATAPLQVADRLGLIHETDDNNCKRCET